MTSSGCLPPPKPWERTPNISGPSPFRPSTSANSTTAIVESSGVAEHGAKSPLTNVAPHNGTILGRPMPPRPWERNAINNYGGYGSTLNYNQYSGSHGTNTYYGGRMGNQYNGGGYGTVGAYGGGGIYGGQGLGNHPYGGGGSHGSGYGGGMYGAGYGMGMGPPPTFGSDLNNLGGSVPPSGPPSLWQSMLQVIYGVVTFFGRISVLVDQNTRAFQFFITALLQFFDRAGLLYGELARFVLRLLGIWSKPKMQGLLLPGNEKSEPFTSETKEIGGDAWDHVWSKENNVHKCG